jgi:hypothetical protein
MSEVKIQAGVKFETTSPAELRALLKEAHSGQMQELATGVKPMDFQATGTIAGAAVTIPQPQNQQIKLGPGPGFLWLIERVSCFGLAAADVLQVHKTVTDGTAFVGNLPGSTGFLHIGSKGIKLQPGQFLVLTGAGLTATGQLIVNGECIEVPAFMLAKLMA